METFSALLAICAGNSPVPVNSPHKGQWRGALMFSLIYTRINGWVKNVEAGDLRRHRIHYDVTVMSMLKAVPLNLYFTTWVLIWLAAVPISLVWKLSISICKHRYIILLTFISDTPHDVFPFAHVTDLQWYLDPVALVWPILMTAPSEKLGLWGRDKLVVILWTTFANSFSCMRYLNSDSIIICSQGFDQQYGSIGSDDGCAPSRR